MSLSILPMVFLVTMRRTPVIWPTDAAQPDGLEAFLQITCLYRVQTTHSPHQRIFTGSGESWVCRESGFLVPFLTA